jgi:hypothetical protein
MGGHSRASLAHEVLKASLGWAAEARCQPRSATAIRDPGVWHLEIKLGAHFYVTRGFGLSLAGANETMRPLRSILPYTRRTDGMTTIRDRVVSTRCGPSRPVSQYGRNAQISGPCVENKQTGVVIWANVAAPRGAR